MEWTLGWRGKGEWRFATRCDGGSWTWTEFEGSIKWFNSEAEARSYMDDDPRTKCLSQKDVQAILEERTKQQEE